MSFFLRPRKDNSAPFIILWSFLCTFAVSRIVVYYLPEVFLTTKSGIHVHHFSYGIILLSVIGLFSLLMRLSDRARMLLCVIYGIALGLAFDEFAMWLELEDSYYDRKSYDAIILIALILLNITYFGGFWRRWGGRFFRIFYRVLKRVHIKRHSKPIRNQEVMGE